MRLLNVGGGSKSIKIPSHYDGWDHMLLDINPKSGAEVLMDARDLKHDEESFNSYDSVYCSHNLEHYYRHDMPSVLEGFMKVVKDDGFVEIHVPNMVDVFEAISEGKDIEDIAYVSQAGPVKYVDIVYGMGAMLEHHGNDFMAHKNGFTPKSLGNAIHAAGFKHIFVGTNKENMEIVAFAFKNPPSEEQMKTLKLKE